MEEYVQLTSWQDLPVSKVVKLKITEKEGAHTHDTPLYTLTCGSAGLSNLISHKNIQEETGVCDSLCRSPRLTFVTQNEIIVCRENKKTKKMELCLHPVNYPRMRRDAIAQWCPVVSFLGPTGGGKSSLICKFNPNACVCTLTSRPAPHALPV